MDDVARKQFMLESAKALEYIDEHLGDLEHESLDVDRGGDVLTIAFADGDRFIINAHSAAQQVWMAAGTRAWHFDYVPADDRWIASKTGDELMSTVASVVGRKLGTGVEL